MSLKYIFFTYLLIIWIFKSAKSVSTVWFVKIHATTGCGILRYGIACTRSFDFSYM